MRLLSIAPHADDEVTFAGFIKKVVNNGGESVIVCMTGGKLRKKEFLQSSKVLGSKPVFLGCPDRGLNDLNRKNIIDRLIRIIRKFKPHIILTVSEYDYHPDHKKTLGLLKEAVEFASHGTKETGWLVDKVLCFESSNLFPYPDYLINIDKEFETKLKAIKKYPSQLKATHKKNYYINSLTAKSAARGVMAGCKYAEACIELKFPVHGNFYCRDRTINKIEDLKIKDDK